MKKIKKEAEESEEEFALKAKKSKKIYVIIGIAALLVLAATWMIIRFVAGGNEDTWIQDSTGVWIKHGNPSEIPSYVLEQQDALNCAVAKMDNFTLNPVSTPCPGTCGQNSATSTHCLGLCGYYAVDWVHSPRTSEDNLPMNECQAYLNGTVSHLIEIDENGNIVRVV